MVIFIPKQTKLWQMNLQNLKFNFFAIYCCQITVTSRFYPIFEFPMLIYQALDAGCRNRKWMKMIRKNNLLKRSGQKCLTPRTSRYCLTSICFANSVSQHLRRINCDECSHEKANKKKFPKIVIKHNEERVDVA